jgi:hypothetical protein
VDPDDAPDGVYDVEVRDAFLEFMSSLMSGYTKYMKDFYGILAALAILLINGLIAYLILH